ncbi:hypothetical protein FISHEDRAFT_35767, partial [Fistulina hepatica ATCC 64428]
TALDRYNALTPLQDSSQQTIEYADIINAQWLDDFELFKCSDEGILKKPWTQYTNHKMMTEYFKSRGVHIKVQHLNIEAHCLHA